MSRKIPNSALIDVVTDIFGTATSPRNASPSSQQVKEMHTAWKSAPSRYREGLCNYLLESVARFPARIDLYLHHMPFLDWDFGRGVLPFWAEAIMGVPQGASSGVPGHSAYVPHDDQPVFWEAWTKHRGSKVDTGIISTLLDPYDPSPQTLSGQRALWLSKSFLPFIASNIERPEFRDSVVSGTFIPLAQNQAEMTAPANDPVLNSMAGYLAAGLAQAWVVDYAGGNSPAWEDWMFEQSRAIWPNYSHLVAGKDSPPHLYGLPEVFLMRVLSLNNRRSQSISDLDPEHLDAIQMGVAKSLHSRAGADGNSVWLPSAKVLQGMAKPSTQLRSFIDSQLLKMEMGSVRAALLYPGKSVNRASSRPLL